MLFRSTEDQNFFSHYGVDPLAVARAMVTNLKNINEDRRMIGASTITQQVARMPGLGLLDNDYGPERKIKEAILSLRIERALSKERIFEIYLNVIEWGDGVFGADAAARHYYHIGAAQLSASQAARLAAMVPNPRYYDGHREAREIGRAHV